MALEEELAGLAGRAGSGAAARGAVSRVVTWRMQGRVLRESRPCIPPLPPRPSAESWVAGPVGQLPCVPRDYGSAERTSSVLPRPEA